MFTSEKIEIQFNKILRNFFFHIVFWYLSFLFYSFLTGEKQLFKVYLNLLEIDNVYLIILFLSIWVSILFSFIDIIFSDRIVRFFPRRLMISIKGCRRGGPTRYWTRAVTLRSTQLATRPMTAVKRKPQIIKYPK